MKNEIYYKISLVNDINNNKVYYTRNTFNCLAFLNIIENNLGKKECKMKILNYINDLFQNNYKIDNTKTIRIKFGSKELFGYKNDSIDDYNTNNIEISLKELRCKVNKKKIRKIKENKIRRIKKENIIIKNKNRNIKKYKNKKMKNIVSKDRNEYKNNRDNKVLGNLTNNISNLRRTLMENNVISFINNEVIKDNLINLDSSSKLFEINILKLNVNRYDDNKYDKSNITNNKIESNYKMALDNGK